MSNRFTTVQASLYIAWKNIKYRIYRSGIMMFFMFVLAVVLFVGMVMLSSMENGIASTTKRLGADLVVVPAKYFSSIENALFTGEPCTVYFDKEWTARLQDVEGVERASSELFLATLNADCCQTRAQLIAFDEDHDFVITPWIQEKTEKNLSEHSLVVGCNLGLETGETVTYYGTEFIVAGVLDESGMGYDIRLL